MVGEVYCRFELEHRQRPGDWCRLSRPCEERGRERGKPEAKRPGAWEPRAAAKRQKGSKDQVAKMARLDRSQRGWAGEFRTGRRVC